MGYLSRATLIWNIRLARMVKTNPSGTQNISTNAEEI